MLVSMLRDWAYCRQELVMAIVCPVAQASRDALETPVQKSPVQRSAEDGPGLTRAVAIYSEWGWARARGMLLLVTIS